jgi:hypothetical protein
LITLSKAENKKEQTITNNKVSEPLKVDKSVYPPRLTKLEKRRLKREAWLEFWLPKLRFIRAYVHQRDKYGWTRPRTCSEISRWVGLPPYKVSRIAQKAIQLGFIAKKGRCYVPKIGRPPVL